MPDNVINKVVFEGRTLVDLTDTTATAETILSGYGAYGADGVWVDGTATAGSLSGHVWQDNEGYIHLDDDGGDMYITTPLNVTENGTYTAPTGVAYTPVSVTVVPTLQSKTVSPTETQQIIIPDGTSTTLATLSPVAGDSSKRYTATVDLSSLQVGDTVVVSGGLQTLDGTSYPISSSKRDVSHVFTWTGESYTYKVYWENDSYVYYNITISTTQVAVSIASYTGAYDGFNATQMLTISKMSLSYDGLSQVSVGAIASDYVGSGVTRRSSSDMIVNGASVAAPAGYYSSISSKSVASGTEGTPIATKGTVSNHAVTVTPSVTNITGYITGGTKTGTAVTVTASELVSGTLTVDSAGTKDVTNYASASIPSGSAIPASSASASGATISSNALNGTITLSGTVNTTPQVSAGYVSSGTAGNTSVSLTASVAINSGRIVNPSLSDETLVTSGTYVIGTIKNRAVKITNLTAENIKDGVTVEVGDAIDSDRLASVTGTYSGGGSTSGDQAGYNDVIFFDYDGTILYSYSASDFASLSALPSQPTHEGLTGQGWNWTLADAKAYVAKYGKLDIGPLYVTDDDKLRLYVTIKEETKNIRLALYNGDSTYRTISIDWGDGSSVESASGSVSWNIDHTYNAVGSYVIKVDHTGFSIKIQGAYDNSTGFNGSALFTSPTESSKIYCNDFTRSILTKVEFSSNVVLGDAALGNCMALETVAIPNDLTNVSMSSYTFDYCYSLKFVSLPDTFMPSPSNTFRYCLVLKNVSLPKTFFTNNTVPTNMFAYCYNLNRVALPEGLTTIASTMFNDCKSINYVTLPDSITSIGGSGFSNAFLLRELYVPSTVTTIGNNAFYNAKMCHYHFYSATPPTITSSTFSSSFGSSYRAAVYVPTAYLSDYKAAQYWSSYSSYITGE